MADYFDYLNNISKSNNIWKYNRYLLENTPIPNYFKVDHHEFPKQRMNSVKTYDELMYLYDINNSLSKLFKELSKKVKPGINTKTLDNWYYKTSTKRGYFPSMLGYENFPKCLSININEEICHNLPYPRIIKSKDLITIDTTLYNGKYHSDCAQSYIFEPSSGTKLLYDVTKQCLDKAISICKPGLEIRRIGDEVTRLAKHHGLSVVEGFSGHGIGKDIHMTPFIPNNKNHMKTRLEAGNVISIEPLIAIGGSSIKRKDNYGYITESGNYACHFERTILITDSGHEILNDFEY